jgi:hypothetical protein
METKTARGFKLIAGTGRNEMQQTAPAMTDSVQQSLLPLRSHRCLIFVSLPDVDHRDFVSLLESAGPAVVVELRRIPRFDIGPLNRQSIFDLFRQQGDVYLDFGTGEFEGSSNEDHLPLKVQKTLQHYVEQKRPFMFLTSTAQEPPSFSKSILKWLQKSNEPWEIYEVPHHGAKFAGGFIA